MWSQQSLETFVNEVGSTSENSSFPRSSKIVVLEMVREQGTIGDLEVIQYIT